MLACAHRNVFAPRARHIASQSACAPPAISRPLSRCVRFIGKQTASVVCVLMGLSSGFADAATPATADDPAQTTMVNQNQMSQYPSQVPANAVPVPPNPTGVPAQGGAQDSRWPQGSYNPQAYTAAMAPSPSGPPPGPTPQSPYQGYYQSTSPNSYLVAQAAVPAAPGPAAPADLTSPAARIQALEATVAQLQQQQQQMQQRQPQTEAGVSEGPDTTPENQGPPAATPESTPKGYVVGSDLNMFPRWDNGLIIESKNKDFTIRVGGRTQFDTNFFGASPSLRETPIAEGGTGPVNDSTQFRRARLRIEGQMWEVIGWVAEYDFANMANVSNIPGNPRDSPRICKGQPHRGHWPRFPSSLTST